MFLEEIKPITEELIFAPFSEQENAGDLRALVVELRDEGKNVVCALTPNEEPPNSCTHYLAYQSGKWIVTELV